MFEKGTIVRNPKQPQWGLGKIVRMESADKISVRFEDGQVRLLNSPSWYWRYWTKKKKSFLIHLSGRRNTNGRPSSNVGGWFPGTFDGSCGTATLELKPSFKSFGSLSSFPNLALMYLLREKGIHSITYYELGQDPETSPQKEVKERRLRLQSTMKGDHGRHRIREAESRNRRGQPVRIQR
jgi:hypothetical protein